MSKEILFLKETEVFATTNAFSFIEGSYEKQNVLADLDYQKTKYRNLAKKESFRSNPRAEGTFKYNQSKLRILSAEERQMVELYVNGAMKVVRGEMKISEFAKTLDEITLRTKILWEKLEMKKSIRSSIEGDLIFVKNNKPCTANELFNDYTKKYVKGFNKLSVTEKNKIADNFLNSLKEMIDTDKTMMYDGKHVRSKNPEACGTLVIDTKGVNRSKNLSNGK